MAFIIGQIFGAIAIVLGFLSYQTKTQKQLLLLQTATCVVFCLHYLFVGAITGMAMDFVGFFRNIVYYYRNKSGRDDKLLPIIFAVISAIMGIITWQAWYSVFVFVGLVLNTLALSFKDPQNVRKSILITSPLVIVYDVFTMAIGGVIYESVAIISSIIGIIRKPGEEKNGK